MSNGSTIAPPRSITGTSIARHSTCTRNCQGERGIGPAIISEISLTILGSPFSAHAVAEVSNTNNSIIAVLENISFFVCDFFTIFIFFVSYLRLVYLDAKLTNFSDSPKETHKKNNSRPIFLFQMQKRKDTKMFFEHGGHGNINVSINVPINVIINVL